MAHDVTVAAAAPRRQEPEQAASDRLEQAFRAEELAGLKVATRALLIALAVIALWLFTWVPPPRLFFLETLLALFALSALLNHRLVTRAPRPWWRYLFVALHFVLLAFSMVGYDLLFGDVWPPPMMLRNGTFVYFFVFLAIVALTYCPQLVLFAGIGGALAWGLGVFLIVRLPSTIAGLDLPPETSSDQELAVRLDPRFVDLDVITQDVIVFLIVAGILAAGVVRARRLVRREAVAARERANLARYFSPRIVDELARSDEPLAAVRAQPVAVLFADIVGFTRLSEDQPPDRVIALLREFHGRLESAVFEHDGTLDKYLGDGVMATFGTPHAGAHDAANALRAGRAMLASVDQWNRERAARGEAPIRLSVGIHHGDVVVGDVGSARRLEFAVIGDVVNVASRLEALSRELATRLVVSDALMDAIGAVGSGDAGAGLRPIAPQVLRGRASPVALWVLAEAA